MKQMTSDELQTQIKGLLEQNQALSHQMVKVLRDAVRLAKNVLSLEAENDRLKRHNQHLAL